SYPEAETRRAHAILKDMGVPLTIHQPSYSILNRWIENDATIEACGELGIGIIAFSPLTQGVLSGKYSSGSRADTRAENQKGSIRETHLHPNVLEAAGRLPPIAERGGKSMFQLALSWGLCRQELTSARIGVRNLDRLKKNRGVLN